MGWGGAQTGAGVGSQVGGPAGLGWGATHPGRRAAPRRRRAAGPAWPRSAPAAAARPGAWAARLARRDPWARPPDTPCARTGRRRGRRGAGVRWERAAPGRAAPQCRLGGKKGPRRCPSDPDPTFFPPGRPALPPAPVSLALLPGSPSGAGSPRPRHAGRVCLPAAQMKPAGGGWAGARKETEPHVLAVGRTLTRTRPSQLARLGAWGSRSATKKLGAIKEGKDFLPPRRKSFLTAAERLVSRGLPQTGTLKLRAGWDLRTGEEVSLGDRREAWRRISVSADLSPRQPSFGP